MTLPIPSLRSHHQHPGFTGVRSGFAARTGGGGEDTGPGSTISMLAPTIVRLAGVMMMMELMDLMDLMDLNSHLRPGDRPSDLILVDKVDRVERGNDPGGATEVGSSLVTTVGLGALIRSASVTMRMTLKALLQPGSDALVWW